MVQANTMSTDRPSDAAVIRIKGTNKALALTTDCNASYIYANPRSGAAIAVAEAARNIVCSGGDPSAISNCLNFGNPLNPEVYWQFVNTILGMTDACNQFDTPVTGGNVSFYNHSPNGGPVLPTPVIGMIGILNDRNNHMTLDLRTKGT
jgi:phosphoribosylformylglycinamidine synthase